MKTIVNYIKNHTRAILCYIGGLLITTGIIILTPKSPWTLIVIGACIIFVAIVSLFDDNKIY